MVYGFSGGTDKPLNDKDASIIDVIDPPNFDKTKIAFESIAEVIKSGAGAVVNPYNSGFRIKADYLPKVVQIPSVHHVVDIDSDGSLIYVSDKAKNLFEQYDPDGLQFAPVIFVDSKGKKVADMHVMFIVQRLDTVDREHTTGMMLSPHHWASFRNVARRRPELVPPGTDLNTHAKLVFNEGRVKGHHLWMDKHHPGMKFMSDVLVDAIDANGLTGLAKVKMDSVA